MKPSLSPRSLLACLFAFLLVCAPGLSFAESGAPQSPRWEYRVLSAKLQMRVLEQMLNTQAAEGWELVQITERGFAVFKRKVR